MTRKDYKAIAEAIHTAHKDTKDDKLFYGAMIQELCVMFYRDNPRFNADKFASACGAKA
jgi:hypothetical protein